MSDTPQGPGWWQASDRKWYPPRPANPNDPRVALQAAIAKQIHKGGRVESQTDYSAVIVRGTKTNHTFHLIASVCTCGLWLVVWSWMALLQRERRLMVSLDQQGQVVVKKL